MLYLGVRKQGRLILIFQKALLLQQKIIDTSFFALIATKTLPNVLVKVTAGSKPKQKKIHQINQQIQKQTED